MTTDNTRTVNKLLDVIQSTLDGFAADYAGSGPGDVFAAQQEVAEVRRLFAQQEHEIARLRGLLDVVGVSLLCAVAYQDGVSPSAHVMRSVNALCTARMGEIHEEMRRCAALVGWDELATGGAAAAGGEE